MPKIVTEEKKREIKRMLEDGRSYTDIKETLHVGQQTIGKVKLEMKGEAKICPSCKRESTANARFCWYCGKDIRDERDLLIDKAIALRGLIVHLPENLQAKYDADTKAVLDYLNRKE